MKPKLKRTWKRQLALIAFAIWSTITFHLVYATPVADLSAYTGIYTTISMAVWGYITAAFGLHAIQENGLPSPPSVGGDDVE